jgi:hypothetical protein
MAASAESSPPIAEPRPNGGAGRVSAPSVGRSRGRRRRRIKRRWISLTVLTAIVTAVVAVARTEWLARELTRVLRAEVQRAAGLELEFGFVGFRWQHLAVRIEAIRVLRAGQRPIATVDALEVRPMFSSLFSRAPRVSSVTVDGGAYAGIEEAAFSLGENVGGENDVEVAGGSEPS